VVRLSRRRFLGAAGALAGVLLTGCGRDAAREEQPPDAEVLSGLLRRELEGGAAVSGVAGAALIAHQDGLHAERLAELSGAGTVAARSGAAADLPAALARKQEGVFAYIAALPRLADPDLRVLVMQVAASEAEHLAALRLAAGEEPVPDAFAGFTEAPER
jgi:hypothetical protein